eukprot:TRINITY_DN19403_c0_g1_i1.p1 TRINITY_DN19403_c0_g1~~TRINITY_DN19403_c0_g1_i1.p1  ORF type:complete len:639 (+),score=144.18 TRINITY_DN19403_c0_g1_i1:155-2071(+)
MGVFQVKKRSGHVSKPSFSSGLSGGSPTASGGNGGGQLEGISMVERHTEDLGHREMFLKYMVMPSGSEEGPLQLLGRFQLDVFVQAMQLQRLQAAAEKTKKVSLLPGLRKKEPERYSVKDMLCFQKDPIPVPMLRLERGLNDMAVRMFDDVLAFMGVKSGAALDASEETSLLLRVHLLLLKHPALRGELYMQLQKQTRQNPYRGSCKKAWMMMLQCAACFPPDKVIAGPLSEYFQSRVDDVELDQVLKDLVLRTWKNLDRTMRSGPRITCPTAEEVESLASGSKLTTQVYLFDENVEQVRYDAMTTVAEATKDVLKRKNVKSSCKAAADFGWYEWRTTRELGGGGGSVAIEDPVVEYIRLDGKRYLADIMADFRTRGWGGFVSSRFLMKKTIFKLSDMQVEDQAFRNLVFIQLRYDYLAGHYTVPHALVARLAALQIASDIGPIPHPENFADWGSRLKRAFPRSLAQLRHRDEFRADILSAFASLEGRTKERCKDEVIRLLLQEQPHGGSIFFPLQREEDSAGFFPEKVLLGLNHSGMHFFVPPTSPGQPLTPIHHAELRCISEYAASADRVFFGMALAQANGSKDVLHTFEFSTTQASDICELLDAHIAEAVRLLHETGANSGSSGGNAAHAPLNLL